MVYLFFAYTIVWLALFGYLYYLTRKTNNLLREIDSLKAQLAQRRPGGSQAHPPS